MPNPIRFSLLFLFFVSCSPTVAPLPQCLADPDCGDGLVCDNGTCVPQPEGNCRSEDTRPCGPAPVGACRKGVQRCVDGAFETSCSGEVTPTAEVCNSIDDDCDGIVDDGVLQTFYVDADGDGFGSSSETKVVCVKPEGFVADSSDCNDAVAAVNPSATEVCDTAALDEDCDGTSNEDCSCTNIGMSQGCCAARGTQSCEARDGGATLTACTVSPSREFCNGVDDDCDGITDEFYAVVGVDGGSVVLSDGGTIELDGGCTVGVGVCARTAGSACVLGSLACTAVAGTPGAEICNGLDDDCDGQTDEVSSTLCPATGQSCGGGTCSCPAAQSICGTSCQSVGGACSAGMGACTRPGSVLCTSGTAACDAVAGTPGTEICNAIDDDCDGQTDEASPSLCAATGQTCSLGSCACPSGQTVCGTSCQTLGGTCSAGVGACNRTGAIACISGGASCNATAGSPVAETCDGIDNDCNGAVDNGVTITCYPDGDNDQYATSATASQQCPDATRPTFGNCPAGFVAPSASLGTDCAATDSAAYRQVSTLADADSDTYCVGAALMTCVGTAAPAGRRFATACGSTSDCDDTNGVLFQYLEVRLDFDGDGYCTGANFFQCSGNAPASGSRVWSTCQVNVDCNDASAAVWVNVSTRADADGDTFCVGAPGATCMGSTVPATRRLTGQCAPAPDDCNDANAAQFTSRQVRTDADSDSYCAGATTTQCAGNAPLAGTRLATSCQGDDCRDLNANATTTCRINGGYWTPTAAKQCGAFIPASETKTLPAGSCPVGFHRILLPYLGSYNGDPGGSCTVLSDTTMIMSCGSLVLGRFSCSINGDCDAD